MDQYGFTISATPERPDTPAQLPEHSANTLFDNPMVNAARREMSADQLDGFQRMGQEYYGGIDFEQFKPQPIDESKKDFFFQRADYSEVEYLQLQLALKSGLQPEDMSPEEQALMASVDGPDWIALYK
jgi:hypothetical protein